MDVENIGSLKIISFRKSDFDEKFIQTDEKYQSEMSILQKKIFMPIYTWLPKLQEFEFTSFWSK